MGCYGCEVGTKCEGVTAPQLGEIWHNEAQLSGVWPEGPAGCYDVPTGVWKHGFCYDDEANACIECPPGMGYPGSVPGTPFPLPGQPAQPPSPGQLPPAQGGMVSEAECYTRAQVAVAHAKQSCPTAQGYSIAWLLGAVAAGAVAGVVVCKATRR